MLRGTLTWQLHAGCHASAVGSRLRQLCASLLNRSPPGTGKTVLACATAAAAGARFFVINGPEVRPGSALRFKFTRAGASRTGCALGHGCIPNLQCTLLAMWRHPTAL